jgi:hypothetical protein
LPSTGFDHLSNQEGRLLKFSFLKFYVRVYGNNRMKDFNKAHTRMIKKSITQRLIEFILYFTRYLLFFNIRQLISKELWRFIK